jgi:hypothetical protein
LHLTLNVRLFKWIPGITVESGASMPCSASAKIAVAHKDIACLGLIADLSIADRKFGCSWIARLNLTADHQDNNIERPLTH